MAKYRVTSLNVSTDKNTYTPYEKVELHIVCTSARMKESATDFPKDLIWATVYKVYSVLTGGQVGYAYVNHTILPTTSIDTETDDFEMELGPFTAIATHKLELRVTAHD